MRSTAVDGAPRWYSVFGLPIVSSIPLPISPLHSVEDRLQPAWSFERAPAGAVAPSPDGQLLSEPRCYLPCHEGRVVSRVHRGPSGTWLWHDTVGTFYITPDASRVIVYPEPEADEGLLRMYLLGQISVVILHQRGLPSLHSSAIETERGAVVFLGPQGQGKSTIAASFIRRGAKLITDDVLPLRARPDGVYGGPSIPIMKLWQETAQHTLRLSDDLPTFIPNYDKKLLRLDGRYAIAQQPVRICALYVLSRVDPAVCSDIAIHKQTLRGGHSALIAQTSWAEVLLPSEIARLMPLYATLVEQAPVRLLRYPSGFEFHDPIRDRILADLEQA
jgi:hypothetical protein